MNDVFVEYLVKRGSTAKTTLMKLGIVLAALVVATVSFVLSGMLGPFSMIGTLVAAGALYGGYHFYTSFNVEFEYAITNGEIDIDKIIAQRKRVRLVSANFRDAEAFGKYKPGEHENKQYGARIFACDNLESKDLWYLATRQKDKGLALIVFNANDKMLGAIKPFLSGPIMHEAFRIGS